LGTNLIRRVTLNRSPAGHKVVNKNDDGKNQKDMNPAAEGIAADQSYDPENEEDNRNSPKHCRSPELMSGGVPAVGK
jgi:hypothetical protein